MVRRQRRQRRAGYIGSLTRIRREIEAYVASNGRLNGIEEKLVSYYKSWQDFVSTHGKLLDVIDDVRERENACSVYEEQIKMKFEFDCVVKSLRDRARQNEHREGSKPQSNASLRSAATTVSSRMSSLSKRREKLALAQLREEQIARKHEMAKKMLELQTESELMEAQMQTEEAMVSVNICEQVIQEEREQELDDIIVHESQEKLNYVPNTSVGERLSFPQVYVNHIPSINQGVRRGVTSEQPVAVNLVPQVANDLVVNNSRSAFQQVSKLGQPTTVMTSAAVAPPRENPAVVQRNALWTSDKPATLYQQSPNSPQFLGSNFNPYANVGDAVPSCVQHETPAEKTVDTTLEIVKALKQVVATPKIEYMHFDGNPIKFPSFLHNFETCLEKTSDSDESKLQLLIQHCHGKAKEAIETCVNLPAGEGYHVAKETLIENFGKPHIIARAHIKKLTTLPSIRKADGPSLLEFARHLESTNRTLKGMGQEYVSDLDHVNTLKELNRKLPIFMRAKWAEEAGKIYERNAMPRFEDYLKFIKKRATLMNNEFGDDLTSSDNKDRDREKGRRERVNHYNKEKIVSFAATKNSEHVRQKTQIPQRSCSMCSGQHGVWQSSGHYARVCQKKHFRCQFTGCGKEHHSLLHPVAPSEADTKSNSASQDLSSTGGSGVHATSSNSASCANKVVAATGAGESRVCLGVIPVKIRTKGGTNHVETYALLDSGSEVTLCHEELCKELQCRGKKTHFTLAGMTGSKNVESQLVDVVIESMNGSTAVELENVRTVTSIPISGDCIPTKKDLEKWPHLLNVELCEASDDKVMLIIGLKENPQLFFPLEYKKGEPGQPIAVRYSLGWTVMGLVGGMKLNPEISVNSSQIVVPNIPNHSNQFEENESPCSKATILANEGRSHDVVSLSCSKQDDETCPLSENALNEANQPEDTLRQQIEGLWKTDFRDTLVETRPCPSVEDKRALQMMEDSMQKVNGHYQVALPWRSYPPNLPNNKDVAVRRCELLKRRLLKDGDLLSKYKATMCEYIEKGHAERIPSEELNPSDRPVWYLPHHPVVHHLKPGKVRVVYDCAAKYKQTSLNQELLEGPDEANRLVGVLSRFRKEPVAIVADVEAMFHQVLVDPKDRDVLRFLWWPDGDLSKELVEYRMVKHVFGAKSSPSIADFCLKKTADLEKAGIELEVVEMVKKNMYVDDLMKSTSTTRKAVNMVDQVRELLSRGGFRLTKWCSNRREVLASIPESERAKSVASLEIDRLPTESTLGVKWNIEEDKFVWEISEERLLAIQRKPKTRRGMLSIIYSLFDPLGMVAPFTMKAKLMLQMLSRMKIGWDDPIGEAECLQWMRWIKDLPELAKVQVDRCFIPESFGDIKVAELHLFSDASRLGYSAAAYLRLVNAVGRIHCVFVMGKARLAPIREITIPKLELSAAVVSVKLRVLIQEELEMEFQRVCHWTDSTSVLKCIFSESKRFHTFESNRLSVIHSESSRKEWRYVNTESNPADDGSKGVKLPDLMKNDRWLKGPEFLWKEESTWPAIIYVPGLKDDDPEVRKEIQIYSTTIDDNPLDELIQHYSSWYKLKRSVAWLLRYRRWLLGNRERMVEFLTVNEIQEAEREILRRVQRVSFPEVLKVLNDESHDTKKSSMKKSIQKGGQSIYRLNPQLKDDIMVVGGRLGNASLDENAKHPVILPYKSHVTDLIVECYHKDAGHLGQETVLANLRTKFWIVKGRSAVRRTLRRCRECMRRNVRPGEQFMANLPADRISPDKPPFTNVGIDYFGPFEVKQCRSRVKRYGCLFTCLTIRAVHVEIANSLNTDSMINALRRFISIRGCPERIRSDRGTNFTAANKELKQSLENLNESKISRFCLQKEIEWVFNPPASSHMGGVWERMIRTVRQVLKATLKEQVVTDEVLSTFMAEAVNIVNSRPLTRNSDSQLDGQPITPNHLLHLRPCPNLPPGLFEKGDLYCKRAWRQAQYLTELFWRRWTREYLPTLMERQKWNVKRRNSCVGDVVLVADDNFARGNWPLARVVEVMPSKDGMVRVARIKTSSTVAECAKKKRTEDLRASTVTLTRPVTKLCLLEMDEQEQ